MLWKVSAPSELAGQDVPMTATSPPAVGSPEASKQALAPALPSFVESGAVAAEGPNACASDGVADLSHAARRTPHPTCQVLASNATHWPGNATLSSVPLALTENKFVSRSGGHALDAFDEATSRYLYGCPVAGSVPQGSGSCSARTQWPCGVDRRPTAAAAAPASPGCPVGENVQVCVDAVDTQGRRTSSLFVVESRQEEEAALTKGPFRGWRSSLDFFGTVQIWLESVGSHGALTTLSEDEAERQDGSCEFDEELIRSRPAAVRDHTCPDDEGPQGDRVGEEVDASTHMLLTPVEDVG